MRRVLFFAYDFPPVASAAAQRTRQFARHLPTHGWQPVVVTPRAGASWAHDPATVEDLPPAVEIRRTPSLEPGPILWALRHRDARRTATSTSSSPLLERLREWLLVPDSRVGWIPFAAAEALRCVRGVDAVLTANPPASAHLAGGLVAAIGQRPWVADFHDPWSLASYHEWRGRWRPWIDNRLERAVLRRADRIVATTAWLADYLSRRGAAGRVSVVANGYEPSEFTERVHPDSAFTVLHAGCFYGPRSPEPLLGAVAAALEAEPGMRASLRLRLRDWKDARNAARLEAAVRRFGLEDVVERVPPVPRKDALAALQASAVLALVTDPLEGGRGLIPLKLFEYLGAGRPVLALAPPDGETGRLVRAAGGAVADPADVAGAAAALVSLYRRWRSGDSGIRPDPGLLERHHWQRLAGELARILDEAVAQTGQG